MNERERVATGPDDATAGTATTSAPRGGWRRCLLLAATAAATLLGAGVSQAQTTGSTCITVDASGTCLLLPIRADTSTPPVTYPQPSVAYMYRTETAMKSLTAAAFAYNSTTGTVGWYGTALPTTWSGTAPAQVLQSAQTSTLKGAAATTSSAVTMCPPDPMTNTPAVVTGLMRAANQYGYTAGVAIVCTGHSVYQGGFINSTAIIVKGIGLSMWDVAATARTSANCPAGAVGFGFNVGVGEVMDNVSLECAVTGSHSATPILGPGIRTGTALCPKGHALTGLQGTVNNNWFGSVNVIGLTGVCTQYPGNSGLGAAGGGVLAYKGTSPTGVVKFSVATKKGTALGAGKPGWDYTLGGFRFAKSCSRASAKVPGKVAVFGRESAGKPTSFSLTSGRFSVTGKLSGKLSKPKVTGRLRILTGACKGKTLRFTATASR